MKYLRKYNESSEFCVEDIDAICYYKRNYIINDDGIIDVDGSVNLKYRGLTKIPLKFGCENNPIFNIWNLFHDWNKVELFNDYDIIRNDTVILDRLNYFLEEISKRTVKRVEGYKCI